MASAKQSDAVRVPVSWFIAMVVLAGVFVVMDINAWELDAPAIILILGWGALVWAGWSMWKAAQRVYAHVTDHSGFAGGTAVDELKREKQRLLKAIKEIEFDHRMGKTSEQDANLLARDYRARAIEIIRELEAHDQTGDDIDSRIERDVAARRAVDRATKAKRKKGAASKRGGK